MSSSRELLEALRSARADETVASVLGTPSHSWLNMNQSPPRSILRDQVDAREAVGVRNWLSYHQQHLQESEKRRIDNRLRAQEAFNQSQAELSALRLELERTRDSEISMGIYSPSNRRPEGFADQQQMLGNANSAENTALADEVNDSALRHHLNETHGAEVPTDLEQPIGTVRDVGLLRDALAERDAVIDRLQNRIQTDRTFYQAQMARLREDADATSSDASAKITGLRAQLEVALQNNRLGKASHFSHLSDGDRSVIERKIDELHTMFHNTVEGVRERTRNEVENYRQEVHRRMSNLASTSDAAIGAAKEVFRADRFEALTLSQEALMLKVTREHERMLRLAEDNIQAALIPQLTPVINASLERCAHQVIEKGPASHLTGFLAEEVKSRVITSLDAELLSAVNAKCASLSTHFAAQMADALKQLSQVAASYAGVDAKGIDNVLSNTQNEFRELRHAVEKASNTQQLEHLAFMAKARTVLERMEAARSQTDRYLSKAAALSSFVPSAERQGDQQTPPLTQSNRDIHSAVAAEGASEGYLDSL